MPTPQKTADCATDLTFDRLFSDELSAAEQSTLHDHLAQCVRCSLRHELLSTQRTAFLERLPTWHQLARRRSSPRTAPLWAAGGLVALAAAALIGFMPHAANPGVRSKGKPQLGVFVKHGERVTRAQSDDTVYPGDQLRFVYTTAQAYEFAVLQRDAHHASIDYPMGTQTARVAAGRDAALDFAIALDDAPGDEQLFGLFCTQPVHLPPLVAALEVTGRLDAPAHCQVDVIRLLKRSSGP